MVKKRPTLDAFLSNQTGDEKQSSQSEQKSLKTSEKSAVSEVTAEETSNLNARTPKKSAKQEIVRHMLYLPLPVYDQLQALVFEEQRGRSKRRKTHDYLLDAVDLLFKKKGLKSIKELSDPNK
jgi:hypothetical protein